MGEDCPEAIDIDDGAGVLAIAQDPHDDAIVLDLLDPEPVVLATNHRELRTHHIACVVAHLVRQLGEDNALLLFVGVQLVAEVAEFVVAGETSAGLVLEVQSHAE